MNQKRMPIVRLCEMAEGQEADVFVQLTARDEGVARNGKPYFRITFRDAGREARAFLWRESAYFEDCRTNWRPGAFYKVRGMYRETQFGPQLELHKVRPVEDKDRDDGFDERRCRPSTEFDPQQLLEQLLAAARDEIRDAGLRDLTTSILEAHRETLLTLPAATRNHHNFAGGFLEHVVSVVRNARMLADKYITDYPGLQPPLSRDLVLAGAVLHDIGKLRELEMRDGSPIYTAEGELIGHVLMGRDIVREAAAGRSIDPELLLRLEHIIVSHQRLPEWGSPKPPMTPEALLVHYADDLDAKLQIMYAALRDDTTEGEFTSNSNALRQRLFRGRRESSE
ncbi:MAG: HD domain-containing protein [Planctomycetes bacterium]|nr:HD domain-containing protein [Planctomycetota bacterium]